MSESIPLETASMIYCIYRALRKCETDEMAILILGCSEQDYNTLGEGVYIEGYTPLECKDVEARMSKMSPKIRCTLSQEKKILSFLKYRFKQPPNAYL